MSSGTPPNAIPTITIGIRQFETLVENQPLRFCATTPPTLQANGAAVRTRGPVVVFRGPTRFKIVVRPEGHHELYTPLGIAFRKKPDPSAPTVHPAGHGLFIRREVDVARRELTVENQFNDVDPRVVFKYDVVVQRESDSAIGVIDPDIENEI